MQRSEQRRILARSRKKRPGVSARLHIRIVLPFAHSLVPTPRAASCHDTYCIMSPPRVTLHVGLSCAWDDPLATQTDRN